MSDEHEPRPTARRWLVKPDMLAALAAVFVGVCALFVSMYQAYVFREQQRIMQEQQRASVWPYIELGASYNDAGLRIAVANQGVGPARIRAVEVMVDGEVKRDWAEVFDALVAGGGVRSYAVSNLQGRVLSADSRTTVLDLPPPAADAVWKQFHRIEAWVCYCSVYDDCWVKDLNAGEAEVADQCEIDPARNFDN